MAIEECSLKIKEDLRKY